MEGYGMETLILLCVLAAPFALIGAVVALLTVTIGRETASR
jgi:hypothetical protein